MSDFVEYLKEVFEQLGAVSARKMFGGYGIYLDGVMFGLVADDTLYLKADQITSIEFEKKGLPAFEFHKLGKRIKMSYYQAPEEIYEDPDLALEWGRLAFEAALRGSTKKGH